VAQKTVLAAHPVQHHIVKSLALNSSIPLTLTYREHIVILQMNELLKVFTRISMDKSKFYTLFIQNWQCETASIRVYFDKPSDLPGDLSGEAGSPKRSVGSFGKVHLSGIISAESGLYTAGNGIFHFI